MKPTTSRRIVLPATARLMGGEVVAAYRQGRYPGRWRVHAVADCTWMMLEEYLQTDDRVVFPIGSTERHGFLSLSTDSLLAERVAVEAAEPWEFPFFR